MAAFFPGRFSVSTAASAVPSSTGPVGNNPLFCRFSTIVAKPSSRPFLLPVMRLRWKVRRWVLVVGGGDIRRIRLLWLLW